MRRQPIEPKFQGCLNCSTIKPQILDLDKEFCLYGVVEFKACGFKSEWFPDGELVKGYKGKRKYIPLTPRKIMMLFPKHFKRGLWIELSIISTMGYHTYEYNKKDGNWYLVEQGRGI
ncbi:TPA: hypothetical protein ACF2DD_002101 [Clostridium perfringens]